MSASTRYAYLDALKIVAIYFVAAIHIVGFKVVAFENSLSWFTANYVSMMARFAVPAFVMCSGAVLLGRTTRTSDQIFSFYKKYLPRYFGYLYLGLVVAKGLSLYIKQDIFILKGLLYDFNTSFGAGMWFFFMLIGLVVVTPILQWIVTNRSLTKLFLCLWFFFCIVNPMFSKILGLYFSYINNMLYGSFFVGYFVLGYFLATTEREIPTKTLLIGAVAGLTLAAIASHIMSVQQGRLTDFFYYSNNPFVFMYTVCMFLLFKNLFAKRLSGPVLIAISSVTGYVYIFHTTVMSLVGIGHTTNIFGLLFIRTAVVIAISVVVSFAYRFVLVIAGSMLAGPFDTLSVSFREKLSGRVGTLTGPSVALFSRWFVKM